MVGGHGVDAAGGRHGPQRVEKLVYVLHLGGEAGAVRLQAVLPVQAVFLEHRPAAAMIHHDGVVAVQLEGDQVGVGQHARRRGCRRHEGGSPRSNIVRAGRTRRSRSAATPARWPNAWGETWHRPRSRRRRPPVRGCAPRRAGTQGSRRTRPERRRQQRQDAPQPAGHRFNSPSRSAAPKSPSRCSSRSGFSNRRMRSA